MEKSYSDTENCLTVNCIPPRGVPGGATVLRFTRIPRILYDKKQILYIGTSRGQEMKREMLSEEWKSNLSKEEIDARLEAWGLDDSPDSVVRFRPRRGETVPVTVRIDARVHHRIMVILAQQYDPQVKTISDAMHDASAKWAEAEEIRFNDGPSGDTLLFWKMERRQFDRNDRKNYLEQADQEIDDASREKDITTLSTLLEELHWKRQRALENDKPKSFIEALDNRIEKVRRILT